MGGDALRDSGTVICETPGAPVTAADPTFSNWDGVDQDPGKLVGRPEPESGHFAQFLPPRPDLGDRRIRTFEAQNCVLAGRDSGHLDLGMCLARARVRTEAGQRLM